MIIFSHSIWLHHDAKCLHDKVKQNDLDEIYLLSSLCYHLAHVSVM